jgi:hypothetical protein
MFLLSFGKRMDPDRLLAEQKPLYVNFLSTHQLLRILYLIINEMLNLKTFLYSASPCATLTLLLCLPASCMHP